MHVLYEPFGLTFVYCIISALKAQKTLDRGKKQPHTMPQLDTMTYLTQLFWLILLYGSFYLFITKYTLPTIVKIIYTRESLSALRTEKALIREELKGNANPPKTPYVLEWFSLKDNVFHAEQSHAYADQVCVHSAQESQAWLQAASVNIEKKKLQRLQSKFGHDMELDTSTHVFTRTALKRSVDFPAQHGSELCALHSKSRASSFFKKSLKTHLHYSSKK